MHSIDEIKQTLNNIPAQKLTDYEICLALSAVINESDDRSAGALYGVFAHWLGRIKTSSEIVRFVDIAGKNSNKWPVLRKLEKKFSKEIQDKKARSFDAFYLSDYQKSSNDYLQSKKLQENFEGCMDDFECIKPCDVQGLKYSDKYKALAVPLQGFDDRIHALQYIYDKAPIRDGKELARKQFRNRYDGATKGHFFVIGQLPESGNVWITESLTTGFSVFMARRWINEAVVVAFSTNNISNVVESFRQHRPNLELIGAADKDKNNAGLNACLKAKIRYAMPNFKLWEDDWKPDFKAILKMAKKRGITSRFDFLTDFNDLHREGGYLEYVNDSLSNITGVRTVEVRQEKLEILLGKGLNLIKSPMGTGKTTLVKRLIQTGRTGKTLIITHRNVLNGQLAYTLDADYHGDIQGQGKQANFLKESERLVITPHSLWKIAGSQWDTIIIDECDQVFKEIATNKLFIGQRKQTLDLLAWLLKSSEKQVLMDATMSERTHSYIQNIGLSGTFFHNVWTRTDCPKVYLYKNKAVFEKRLLERMIDQKIYIASNSKTWILGDKEQQKIGIIERMTEEQELRSTVITSDTKESQELIGRLQNGTLCNQEFLFMSPAGGTGVNIDKHNYECSFAMFEPRVTDVEDCLQQLYRVRGLNEYHIYISEYQEKGISTDKDDIIQSLYDAQGQDEATQAVANEVLTTCIETGERKPQSDLALDLYGVSKALSNVSRRSFRGHFLDVLNKTGHDIVTEEACKEEVEVIKAERKAENIARQDKLYLDIQTAPLLDDDAYTSNTDTKSYSYHKTTIARQLNITDTATLNDLTFADIEKGYVSKHVKHLASLIDETFPQRQADWIDDDALEIQDRSFYEQIRLQTLQLLSYAGISRCLDYDGTTWRDGVHPALKKYLQRNQEQLLALKLITKAEMRDALKYGGNTAKALNGVICRIGSGRWLKRTRIRINETSTAKTKAKYAREYSINDDSLRVDQRYAEALANYQEDWPKSPDSQ